MKKQTLTAHPTVRTLFHEMDKQLYIYIYVYNVYIPYIANRSHEPILRREFIKHKNERVHI